MAEAIESKKLYHVTVGTLYKAALTANQVLNIGASVNPYFGFYENAREYPITENGNVVHVKALAWLKHVRAGTINPASTQILATIAAEVAQHYVMLARELIMEELRISEFQEDPPSRQRCLYVAETIEGARRWKTMVGGGTICELTCTGSAHRADANLLLEDSEPLSVTRDRARRYWRGEIGADPLLETLFVGKATVTAFDLT